MWRIAECGLAQQAMGWRWRERERGGVGGESSGVAAVASSLSLFPRAEEREGEKREERERGGAFGRGLVKMPTSLITITTLNSVSNSISLA